MGHGGKRNPPGGRPKGRKNNETIAKEVLREQIRAYVAQNLPEMLKAQVASSKGIHFLVVRDKKTGKYIKRVTEDGDLNISSDREVLEIYAKDPSAQAFSYLVDQTVDKAAQPKQEIEVTHKDLGDKIRKAWERAGTR